ncbi:M24 family metallopeptidase [Kitasatospora mediocidica]|uniref:M24 family metallopeptidase n=1 Tax=Kitasatospora mediocidica TaxID=58352 RepID=UPI0005628DA2|nr:M24 family metallopeptidase [Kitasatospora mediocidica]
MHDEPARVAGLLGAQAKAEELFAEVEKRGLIAAGQSERAVSDRIRDLANEMFDIKRYWHKRIVRTGANTLHPYRENPPDLVIAEDDIVFVDFGPIFEEWEADFGRTFVLGDDPVKQRLRDDLPVIFAAGRRYFETHQDVTGAQLHAEMARLAAQAGWGLGGWHAGHLVGEFPHEEIAGDDLESHVTPGSDHPMRRTDRIGQQCHWILEVHLLDPDGAFGGFYEELLDL